MRRFKVLVVTGFICGLVAVAAPLDVAGADAASWQVAPSPNPSGSIDTSLDSVTCLSSSDCTAVGYWENGSGDQTLIETWDGISWQITPSPDPSSGSGGPRSRRCLV